MSDKPANKIVSSNRLSLKPANKIVKAGGLEVKPPPKTKPRKMNKSPRNMKKWTMRQMLKMAKESPEYKKITGKLKPISLEQQFKQFQAVDDAIKLSSKDYQPEGSRGLRRNSVRVSDAEWKRMHNAAATKHVNKLTSSYRYFDHNLNKLIKERGRLSFEINKKLQAGVKAPSIPKASLLKISNLSRIGSGIGQLGAGIALNALTDKFVKPHTDELGRRLGTSLGRWAKEFDENQLNKENAKKKEK